eukprot:Sspe_Gene.34347::Locus_16710_Transcript_2_3_Confidence_0.500_Length_1030::g.34347::m.34347
MEWCLIVAVLVVMCEGTVELLPYADNLCGGVAKGIQVLPMTQGRCLSHSPGGYLPPLAGRYYYLESCYEKTIVFGALCDADCNTCGIPRASYVIGECLEGVNISASISLRGECPPRPTPSPPTDPTSTTPSPPTPAPPPPTSTPTLRVAGSPTWTHTAAAFPTPTLPVPYTGLPPSDDENLFTSMGWMGAVWISAGVVGLIFLISIGAACARHHHNISMAKWLEEHPSEAGQADIMSIISREDKELEEDAELPVPPQAPQPETRKHKKGTAKAAAKDLDASAGGAGGDFMGVVPGGNPLFPPTQQSR